MTPVIFLLFPPSLAMYVALLFYLRVWCLVTNVELRVVGNIICKASSLPHFPRTLTAFYIGAAGSWVGTMSLFSVSWFSAHCPPGSTIVLAYGIYGREESRPVPLEKMAIFPLFFFGFPISIPRA